MTIPHPKSHTETENDSEIIGDKSISPNTSLSVAARNSVSLDERELMIHDESPFC